MRKLYLYSIFIFFQSFSLMGQVGINNPNPTATLDVNGSVLVQKNLFLENPHAFSIIRGSKMLIEKTNDQIVQYDIEKSKYGPINYAQFVFRNTNKEGLQDYDTKISTTDYLVTVQGFYFLIAGTTNTNVTVRNDKEENYVEGFQMYAYAHPIKNTWHIRGFVNNSTFRHNGDEISIDLYMNLIIFRNGFIAKPLNDITVNMGNVEVITAPLPSGF